MITDFPTAPLAPGLRGAGGGTVEKSFSASHTEILTLPLGAVNSSLTLVPVSVGSASANAGVIRLHSPGGWRIELPTGSAPWLAEVLGHLP